MMKKIFYILSLLLALLAVPAIAAPVDCSTLNDIDTKKTYEAQPSDIRECAFRGYDPPKGWRPPDGVRAAGAGGFSYSSVQAPSEPPGSVAVNANASVSSSTMDKVCKFSIRGGLPPKLSFGSCQKYVDGLLKGKDGSTGSDTGGGIDENDSCPAENDTTGLYGVRQALSASTVPLTCGGALPLSSYRITLSDNPRYMAVTEGGDYHVRIYEKTGSGSFNLKATVALPDVVGQWLWQGEGGGYCEYTYNIMFPIPQTFLYDGSSGHLVLRLASSGGTNPETSTRHGYYTELPEKFLIMPLNDGVPYVVDQGYNCPDESMYTFEPAVLRDDLVIESPNTDCTGTAAQCAANNTTSCDILALYPTTGQTPDACIDKTQYAALSVNNAIYPPGTSPTFYSIQGRTGLLAKTANPTQIYTAGSTDLKIGPSAPPLKVNEGGIIRMTNGDNLQVNPSATIVASQNLVQLTGGGTLLSPAGYLKQTIAAGSNYSLNGATKPLTITLGSSLNLPEGYLLPTASSPYIRLPIDNPK